MKGSDSGLMVKGQFLWGGCKAYVLRSRLQIWGRGSRIKNLRYILDSIYDLVLGLGVFGLVRQVKVHTHRVKVHTHRFKVHTHRVKVHTHRVKVHTHRAKGIWVSVQG